MNGARQIRRKVDIASKFVVECAENSEIKRLLGGGDHFAFSQPYDFSADSLTAVYYIVRHDLAFRNESS